MLILLPLCLFLAQHQHTADRQDSQQGEHSDRSIVSGRHTGIAAAQDCNLLCAGQMAGLTGESLFALFRSGGSLGHNAIIPLVAQGRDLDLDFFLANAANSDFLALISTGSSLGYREFARLMAQGIGLADLLILAARAGSGLLTLFRAGGSLGLYICAIVVAQGVDVAVNLVIALGAGGGLLPLIGAGCGFSHNILSIGMAGGLVHDAGEFLYTIGISKILVAESTCPVFLRAVLHAGSGDSSVMGHAVAQSFSLYAGQFRCTVSIGIVLAALGAVPVFHRAVSGAGGGNSRIMIHLVGVVQLGDLHTGPGIVANGALLVLKAGGILGGSSVDDPLEGVRSYIYLFSAFTDALVIGLCLDPVAEAMGNLVQNKGCPGCYIFLGIEISITVVAGILYEKSVQIPSKTSLNRMMTKKQARKVQSQPDGPVLLFQISVFPRLQF